MKFVRYTAIERRSLTPAQKLDIILNTEELIKSVYEDGKKKREANLKKGVESPIVSADTNGNSSHDSLNKIAEMAGMS